VARWYNLPTMETLEKLFGSAAKIKLIKLFVFNPEVQLSRDEIMTRAKVSQSETRRTLSMLLKASLLKERKIWKEGATSKKRVNGYMLDPEFPFLKQLRQFLLETATISDRDIIQRLSKAGKLRLVITAGVFLQDWDSRADLLVVGDNLRNNAAENAIRSIEADMGRELRYVIFETEDFKYRHGMYDKLIRDIVDFHHHVVLDKVGVAIPPKE
jgi:hypothetical protein